MSPSNINSSCVGKRRFANYMLTIIDDDGFVFSCICFSDVDHFHLDGFVNKLNRRFWGTKNPHLCEALHSLKVTILVAASSKAIIGIFFLRGTIITKRYVAFLEQFSATLQGWEDRPGTWWFMQNGARPHHIIVVLSFLENTSEIVIALNCSTFAGTDMDWPPYWLDLTPCHLFSVGHI